MKILIIGASGTIGKPVSAALRKNGHEVLEAGRSHSPYTVDITDASSISRLLEKTGKLDALISMAGTAKWAPFSELTEADYQIGLNSKLMGQVNLVRLALPYLSSTGSITLTTGILADRPVPQTSSAAMVNGALHSFVKAASLEIDSGKRINVVSTGVVADAYDHYADYFSGHTPIAMDRVVHCYTYALHQAQNGELIKVYD
jgi:NAD(P)-dependent dehydrogenase (short-subunit alcohol dehydrogenase family)